jgi:thiosulfate/3-mercaptopyruvate sulfurtransferase
MEIGREELVERLAEVTLLDVRTAEEFRGEVGYPCDPHQGHIPGARNLELDDLLRRSPEEIRALVGLPVGAEVVAYCHTGGRSALATEVLRAAGYEARNYAGSWHEWSREG